ncbi:amino acid adenylation domain-containing protein [Amycolatopsis azurea]|uniref:non-ribosomal peptide synthetase n=1 Tax=Amycolatopsis azurea TaxID=36819 RepID=UPI003819D753
MAEQRLAKDVEDIYELSPIQQGLLFEQLAQPGIGIYIEQLRLEFTGTLYPELFERAWQLVVDRHPVLRSSFHWRKNGTAMQVVHRTARLPLEYLDWREIDRGEQDARLDARLDAERLAGFEPTEAPLMLSTLIRRDEEAWTFSWRFSHLLMDGWSFTLAIQDFIDNYRSLCRHEEPTVAPARPYRDYLAWWRSRTPEESQRFWLEELGGYEPFATPSDGARLKPGERTHSYFERRLTDLAPQLADLAAAERLTLATLVQGAWMIVLGRYFAREDIACGITMAHRPQDLAGAESILGPMIATLPVRQRLVPTRALRAWLRDFGRQVAVAGTHSDVPLARLQSLSESPNAQPLLQSSVSYENVPMPNFDLTDVGATMVDLSYDGRPHYPITMVIMPGDDMPLRVMFDRRRFSDAVAQRFADDLISVLHQIVNRPDITLGELSLAVPRRPAVTNLSTVDSECLHETFARHARATPDDVAVRFADEELTYRELDRYSDLVATAVRAHGGDVSRVGLCLEHSPDLIASIIGVLKAGAAYVPLDPAYPHERLADLVADSGAELVLGTTELAHRVPYHPGRTLLLGEDIRRQDAAGASFPDIARDPDAAAYLLYTSGSTGRPKGVLVSHHNVQTLLAAGRALFGFDAGDVWTFSHSFAFDYSVWEIWGALGNGGRLVIVPRQARLEPRALARLLHDEQVTVLSLTPAVFEHVVSESDDAPAALRRVFLGGDRLEPAAVRPWFDRFAGQRAELYNLYGVTEATVVSTCHRILLEDLGHVGSVPIGHPLPNQRAYLFDEHGRQVPQGGTGELWVAGPAVAAGYHAREELTAQRFTEDPFFQGERLYRTGDLVSEGPDGALRFLGRADSQVKIRGFRVEPGEIESALRAHPAVLTATVVVQDSGPAAQVVGYVVPQDPGPNGSDGLRSADAVRDFAAARLPEHMVPAAVYWIPQIPTTPAGKVDTAALPRVGVTPAVEYQEPRTELERVIGAAVAEILGVERIGVRDRLAELGLHSIGAMRLMARMRAEYRLEISLPDLLEAPSVAELAERVGDRHARTEVRS